MEKIRAVMLNNLPFAEGRYICRLFSKERGFISAITPISFLKKRGNRIQAMQICEVEYIANPRGGLHKINSIYPIVNTPSIYSDIFKMNIALLWGETLAIILANEGKNESLYLYIENAVEYLHTSKEDIANFNLYFFYRLAGMLGFRINTDTFRESFVFNISDGNFYPKREAHGYITGPHSASIINQLCSTPLKEIAEITLNRRARSTLLEIIFMFYQFHLNINLKIKSISVIREVFNE